MVPDLAGWKKERFPFREEHNSISVAPNWVCEILSPSTVQVDKIRKMPLYARHAVEHIWLVDPIARTMDVFRLESGRWYLLGSFAEQGKFGLSLFRKLKSTSRIYGSRACNRLPPRKQNPQKPLG